MVAFYQLLYLLLPLVAAATSCVFLIVHWREGAARLTTMAICLGWFVLALCLQFLAHAPLARATGLTLQTLLAITLIVWWNAG